MGKHSLDLVSELLNFFSYFYLGASNIWIRTLKLGLLVQKFFQPYNFPWLNIILSMSALTAGTKYGLLGFT